MDNCNKDKKTGALYLSIYMKYMTIHRSLFVLLLIDTNYRIWSTIERGIIMFRQRIRLSDISIEKSEHKDAPDREVLVLRFEKEEVGVGGHFGTFVRQSSVPAYNEFVGTQEWRNLHPRLMNFYGNSDRLELCSSETQDPHQILSILKENFISDVLDNFNSQNNAVPSASLLKK